MHAVRNVEYCRVLSTGTWNLVDGVGLSFALYRRKIFAHERLCGSDLVHELAALARDAGRSLFIVGGSPDRLKKACAALEQQHSGLRVSGFSPSFHPDFPSCEQSVIEAAVSREQPAVVAICLGAPKQELWIHRHHQFLSEHGVCVAAGLGGTVDFLSGEVPRAPLILRKLGLEWLFRLWREPRRLRRQLNTLPAFALRTMFDKSFIRCVSQRQRVVLYAHYAPPHPSASATRILSLARYLRKASINVLILSSQHGEGEFDGFPIVRVPDRLKLVIWLLRNRGSPILVTSPPATPAAEVAMAARFFGYRVVVDIRDPFVSEAIATGDLQPGLRTRIKHLLEASLFRSAHAVSFVSQQLHERMIGLMGEIPRPSYIAPNGVDKSIFYLASSASRASTRAELGLTCEPTFVYAGILGGKKIGETLIALAPALKAGARLLIICVLYVHSQFVLARLKAIADEIGIQERILWRQNLPLEQVARHLNACDIGVNPLPPSRSYCLPVKTYEYLACGLYNLAYGARDGALSHLLADRRCGQLCSDWKIFSDIALELSANISRVRSGVKDREEYAHRFDRDLSNAMLLAALFGDRTGG